MGSATIDSAATEGTDEVNGGDGNDRIRGGGGADTLNGDAGDDRINGRGDGRAGDTINCGDGTDVVKAGRNDVVAADCETARQPGKGKPYAIHPKPNKPKKPKNQQALGHGPPTAARRRASQGGDARRL